MMKKREHNLWLLCIVLLPAFGWGQGYGYSAKIDLVPATGFYRIAITPQIAAHTKTDFSDIRILDKEKHNVPHLLRSDNINKADAFFVDYPILQNKLDDSGRSEVIIYNLAKKPIDHISIFLKNTSSIRYANLSGSDDRATWFTIKEHFAIGPSLSTSTNGSVRPIEFPNTDYKYLKILIQNEGNDPLNILGTGNTLSKVGDENGSFENNPAPIFNQIDSSNHHTYIRIEKLSGSENRTPCKRAGILR